MTTAPPPLGASQPNPTLQNAGAVQPGVGHEFVSDATENLGGVVVLRSRVFDASALRRSITRIGHEIVERNYGAHEVVLVGLYSRGVELAQRLASSIQQVEGVLPQLGMLDVAFFRDDIGLRAVSPSGPTEVPDVTDKIVVLVDDVLFTGRTIRAALDAMQDLGRPRAVQLAVLVDRGHRELPIRADYVGKNLPTSLAEDVRVRLGEVDGGEDGVELWGPKEGLA